MSDKCLVTITIGDAFQKMWNGLYRGCMERYAEKHGYDLVVIDDYLDGSEFGRSRPPHWQKLLILEHPEVRRYRHAVWVDADILINYHHAPCIVAANPTDKIGVVYYQSLETGSPAKAANRYHRRCHPNPCPTYREWYNFYGLGDDVDDFTNTGVLVLRPARDAEFLRWIYDTCKEVKGTHQENGPLSYHLFKRDLAAPIDDRFNVTWNGEITEHYPFLLARNNFNDTHLVALCVNAAWHNSFFMHFIGSEGRHSAPLVITHRSHAIALEVAVAPAASKE